MGRANRPSRNICRGGFWVCGSSRKASWCWGCGHVQSWAMKLSPCLPKPPSLLTPQVTGMGQQTPELPRTATENHSDRKGFLAALLAFFLKQMETGGRGRLIVEGSTCCPSSWMFWVMWTIQVECASALKQVFILVVVVTDKQLQFCW